MGKTKVLTSILTEMKQRGLLVGTIKHIGEGSVFDGASRKDTSRHLEAGSEITLAVTSQQIIAFRRDLSPTLQAALTLMPTGLDYILVEGFRQSKYPKVVVVESLSEDIGSIRGRLIALVVDEKEIVRDGTKRIRRRFDIKYMVDIIMEYFHALE